MFSLRRVTVFNTIISLEEFLHVSSPASLAFGYFYTSLLTRIVWSYLSALYEVVLIPGGCNIANMPLFPSTQQVMGHLLSGPGLKYLTRQTVGGWGLGFGLTKKEKLKNFIFEIKKEKLKSCFLNWINLSLTHELHKYESDFYRVFRSVTAIIF